MTPIAKARAWCNNEVAYLAWTVDQRVNDLLGFMIVRVHEDTGERRLLPTWTAFEGQTNPNWLPQDTSVWPVQKFEWRDLTMRRSRDGLMIRDAFECHYDIWPVGTAGPGRLAVADWRTQNPDVFTSFDPAQMTGVPRPLFLLSDEPFRTNSIKATSAFGDFTAVFTNGILSTQNLRKQLNVPAGQAPSAKLLRDEHTKVAGDPIRTFLSGDVLPEITGFLDAIGPNDTVYAALYELSDGELVSKLLGLGKRLHLILSTAGSSKATKAWDTENHDARVTLHDTAHEVIDRLFNNSGHIGHNKFVVHVDANGTPQRVLTGSTNWTDTGLCCQSNNTLIVRSPTMAKAYFDYWQRLKADTAGFAPQVDTSAPNNNVQGPALRSANAQPFPAPDISTPSLARFWPSPNTVATSNTPKSPPPMDLTDVFSLMRGAKQAIFFLTFLPSQGGKNSVIDMAIELGKENTDLLVQGAISSPMAMPNFKPAKKTGSDDTGDGTGTTPSKAAAVYSPEGAPKVLAVRASALKGRFGDMDAELLSAGFAIIHDKIVVVDPFSPDCAVITGSHNLGFKASYANDDNLVIIQGNQNLAQAYAVHVLDVFEHYRFRADLEDKAAPGTGVILSRDGYLATNDSWQDAVLSPETDPGLRRFL